MLAALLVAGVSTYHLMKMRSAITKSVVIKKKVYKAKPKHIKHVEKKDTLYVVLIKQ
jgi:hypothetical protein